MKFTVIKTTIVTKKELYMVEIAGFLDPISYMASEHPNSTTTMRDESYHIFRHEEDESE